MMMINPFISFFLAFIPGVGHLYLNIKFRGVFYLFGFFGSILLGLLAGGISGHIDPFVVGLIVAFFIWLINMVDIVATLINRNRTNHQTRGQSVAEYATHHGDAQQAQYDGTHHGDAQQDGMSKQRTDDEHNFYTILLSLMPGLGHFHLGLMHRGLTFLIAFFGLGTMIVFVTMITDQNGFLAFLGVLPIIWLYNMFDATQLISRRKKGEELIDQTILEDFVDARNENGKKSKALATILSIFPGAGHMYLGLQKRGFQLMAVFLLTIFVLDVLKLSFFLFLVPLIWCFSFFDALQKVSKHGEEEQLDIPVISYLMNHQKWLGIGLLALGLYYLFDNALVPVFGEVFMRWFGLNLERLYYDYFQVLVICILLIGGGLKLIWGSRTKK